MNKNNMKSLKTAPQILEHYLPLHLIDQGRVWGPYILKAMRHYNRTKIERLKEKLREEVKDEIYEEARRNLIEQYTQTPQYEHAKSRWNVLQYLKSKK